MSRSVSVKPTLKEYTTIILAGLTERWYFSHLQSFYNLKIKIRPRFLINFENLRNSIKQTIHDEGKAIIIYNRSILSDCKINIEQFAKFKQKYEKNNKVMFCEVSPSIEWWFVLHYIEGDQVFETSEAVKDELKKHIKDFEISDSFLMNPKWVEELCSDNKLIAAYNRAKKYNKTSENQMSIWKIMEEIGLFS